MSIGKDNHRWVLPAGSRADDSWELVIDDSVPGWQHTGLRVARLGGHKSESVSLPCDGVEAVVVPLSGGAVHVRVADANQTRTYALAGRSDVFAGPTDVLYVPAGARLTLMVPPGSSEVSVAVCLATVVGDSSRRVRHLLASDVPVELRGAGVATRQVRNFGVPGVLDADRMIACEVITPAGNWSSWPPHKHDTHRAGVESELEEIYFFGVRSTRAVVDGGASPDPFGYQRVYGTVDRPVDVLAEVRDGDAVLVPHGWHGPAIAAPDADLYYLNVMAGPGPERAWLICDDPAHGWVRDSWVHEAPDPRLAGQTPAG